MPRTKTAAGPQKGRRPPFGPVAHPYESVSLSPFAKSVLHAAAARAGYPKSNVVDLLVRKFGGAVTAGDFPADELPCGGPALSEGDVENAD